MHPREKIVPLDNLRGACQLQKSVGKKIVLTSGCFDILHGGHLEYLYDAGELGYLVVGINSDIFVKKLKGESRPIRVQDDRAFLLAGFYPVQLVTIFDCDYALIEAANPDIYVASATSVTRIWEDSKRVELLEKQRTLILEFGSKKTDSTTDIIKRAGGVV